MHQNFLAWASASCSDVPYPSSRHGKSDSTQVLSGSRSHVAGSAVTNQHQRTKQIPFILGEGVFGLRLGNGSDGTNEDTALFTGGTHREALSSHQWKQTKLEPTL